ncbi:MAG: hypothetical protein AB9866_21530 [Syntrophobacteraceae bacterium]
MRAYLVKPGTQIIAIKEHAPWRGLNLRIVPTQVENMFTEDNIILNPTTCACTHHAEHAQTIGPAYAKIGYYGFLRDGHIMLVLREKVDAVDQVQMRLIPNAA